MKKNQYNVFLRCKGLSHEDAPGWPDEPYFTTYGRELVSEPTRDFVIQEKLWGLP